MDTQAPRLDEWMLAFRAEWAIILDDEAFPRLVWDFSEYRGMRWRDRCLDLADRIAERTGACRGNILAAAQAACTQRRLHPAP